MSNRVVLPNIRKLFIPDEGYDCYDCDLSGADAQVVAWEADDEELKAAFRAKIDVHSKNAEDMFGSEFTRLTGHARYAKRQSNKHSVHACNYGSTARGMAAHPAIGWTVHECDRFRKRWFDLHPKIGPVERKGSWHWRIQQELDKTRTIVNQFGYRRVYFDRPDECFTEALAWKPQSTVALVTFYGALQLEKAYPDVEILLQVHDSLVFQRLAQYRDQVVPMVKAMEVVIPYADPLIIPWGVARSNKSWGDCEKLKLA